MSDQAPRLADGAPYRLGDLLGAGAMGEVWRARDERTGTQVVVKIMKSHLPAGLADRLRLEADALARIDHPNVVRVLGSGATADGRPYLVMEFLVGRPLDVVLREREVLPAAEAVGIARQLVGALCFVHDAGFVHRDVKPPNVFVCDDGNVKLLDFGVIKLVERVTGVAPLQVPTRHGSAIGTPSYMSPEQALARHVDGRADVYGAGLVLYVMLTGKHPFAHHRQLKDMLIAHVKEMPPPPSALSPQAIPEALDRLVLAALTKDAAHRISGPELFRALVEFGTSQVVPAPDVPAAELPTRVPLSKTGPLPGLTVAGTGDGPMAPALPFASRGQQPGTRPSRPEARFRQPDARPSAPEAREAPPAAAASQVVARPGRRVEVADLDATPPPVASAPEQESAWQHAAIRRTFWIAAALGFAAGLALLGRFF